MVCVEIWHLSRCHFGQELFSYKKLNFVYGWDIIVGDTFPGSDMKLRLELLYILSNNDLS